MNLLKYTRLYTIGSMEYADGQGWRNQVKKELGPLGITIFDPYHKPYIEEIAEDTNARKQLDGWRSDGKYQQIHDRMKAVRSDDLRLCDISDFFIVNINPRIASWGSAEELVTAVRMKKPIFIVIEGGIKACPFWIFGMVPVKYLYNSLEDAINMIKDIDSGKRRIDSSRWHLLKMEYR
jgi:hypothetical protein